MAQTFSLLREVLTQPPVRVTHWNLDEISWPKEEAGFDS